MKKVRLGEVAAWSSGGTPKRSVDAFFGGEHPWVSISDLNEGLVMSTAETLSASGLKNSSAKLVPAGTILVAMYGSIGKLGVAATEVCTSQAIACAQPDLNVVAPRYLFHFLRAARPRMIAAGRGGTQMNIGQGFLKSLEMPLPSLPEQRRIADILDKADALRAKRQKVLDNLDALTQSIFHDMFGDPTTWGEVYQMRTIGELASEIQYGTSQKAGSSGAWPVLRMGNIDDHGRLNLSDLKYLDLSEEEVPKYTVEPGDLLFNRTNSVEKVGKAAVVMTEEPLAFAGYLVRVRFVSPTMAHFVATYLRSPHGRGLRRKMAKAAVNQANISAAEFAKIYVPDLNEDQLMPFVQALVRLRKLVGREHKAGQRDIELAEALAQRAFAGGLWPDT